MKIVFFTLNYPPQIGGIATYVSLVAESLQARGWSVRVLARGYQHSGQALADERIVVEPVVRGLPQLISASRWADVVHLNGFSPLARAARASATRARSGRRPASASINPYMRPA